MDKIEKALQRLTSKEQKVIRQVLIKIKKGDFSGLDIKKLKGYKDIFRAKKRAMRIIYRLNKDGKTSVLAVERRFEKTYKF